MRFIEKLLELIYPRKATCLCCGAMIGCDRNDLCEDCRAKMAQEWVGPRPVAKGLNLDGASFAHPYRGPAGGMVRALKYASVRVIANEMSRDLAAAVRQLRISGIDCITYVPMHPRRVRTRGFNHAELLARGTAERLNTACEELLERTRNAKQQARLDKQKREQNLKGGFVCTRDLKNKTIVLIDDVLTTGATAKYCAKALRAAGAQQVYFVAYAVGDPGKKK